jgi:hypothetical protein
VNNDPPLAKAGTQNPKGSTILPAEAS